MSYIQVRTIFSGIGLTRVGGGTYLLSQYFFLPKHSFLLTTELKIGR